MARKKQEEKVEEKIMESELGPTADDVMKLWNDLGSSEEESVVTDEGEEGKEEPLEGETQAKGEADYDELLKLLPEKFKSEDPKEALKRFVESYRDLESRLTRTSMELTEATKLLRTLAGATSAKPVPESKAQSAEGENLDIRFDIKPEEYYQNLPEAVQKTVIQAIKQAASRYDPNQQVAQTMQQVMAQMALAQLRSHDPKTFELVKGDLLEVLREKPHLDTIEGLEIAYEEAKQRYKARQEELRRQLIDENFISNLKESILRDLAPKVTSQAREAAGVPQGATGGGSSEVAREQAEKKSPSELLSDMIMSVGAKAPLLTEDF